MIPASDFLGLQAPIQLAAALFQVTEQVIEYD